MRNNKDLIWAGAAVLILTIVGAIGYMLIEHYQLLDALYMTVISMSTVGYGEVHKLSSGGKIFTMFLILSSLGIVGYFLTQITQNIFRTQVGFFFGRNQRQINIRKMKNHVIVCGYGRNGRQVASELVAHGEKVIVIEEKHNIVAENLGNEIQFFEGDATEDEVLLNSGIATAKALITALPIDADNLYVVLSARALNPNLNIISRAADESAEKKLRMAGVNSVVTPERIGGSHMATLVAQPDVVEFLEKLNVHGDSPVQLMEILCSGLPADLINKPIKDIDFRKLTGINILGYKTASGEYIVNPSPDTRLYPDAKLFVLGTRAQIKDLSNRLGGVVH
ncbi:MAG: potassium channel protein [Bacteroidales bacterium]|nr:potassium channel protein [Bacteroidales bacterium]